LRIELSVFDLLILIGMVTGVICSLLLFQRSARKPSNRYLALGILAFVWLNTKTLLHSFDLWDIHGVGYFPNAVELTFAPLFYLYLRTLVQPTVPLRRKDLLHFIPFALSQAYSVVVYLATLQTHDVLEKRQISGRLFFDEVKTLDEYLMLVGMVVYLYLAYPLVRQANPTTQPRAAELRFVKLVFRGFVVMGLYSLVNLILNFYLGFAYAWRWQLANVLVASMVYYLGIVGYKNSEVHTGGFALRPPKPGPEKVSVDLLNKLTAAVEIERVYLDPKLSLRLLAQRLGVSEPELSKAIQTQYQKNFRGFINEVRVREVQERLRREGLGNLSLLGLAKECGFNSEASFYRVFKEHTGMTPKQYLEQQ